MASILPFRPSRSRSWRIGLRVDDAELAAYLQAIIQTAMPRAVLVRSASPEAQPTSGIDLWLSSDVGSNQGSSPTLMLGPISACAKLEQLSSVRWSLGAPYTPERIVRSIEAILGVPPA